MNCATMQWLDYKPFVMSWGSFVFSPEGNQSLLIVCDYFVLMNR